MTACGRSPPVTAAFGEPTDRPLLVKAVIGWTVINALIKQAHKLPNELYKSLTWDRGKEMADHKRFTLATDVTVYFCDPQNP
jgi:IS30 family transposase